MKRLEKLAGYSILGALGKGGMGVVYVGFDDKKNRLAALKVLSDQIAPDPVAVQRFRREADLYKQINHPNVVEAYDTGQFRDTHYIALELVQGKPLNEILAAGQGQRPTLSIVHSVEIFRSMLSALQTCHEMGIVHRDLKPHNVIINPFGITKLLDFGVAQVTDDDMNLTKTGLIIGTLVYASPEQNQGKAVDGRSDLYSLGLMLYELLTGQRMFRGSNVGEIILQQIQCTKATISDKVQGMPPQFDAYFAKLLHPMVTSRWETARDAFTELDKLVQSLGPQGREFFYGTPVDELWFASRIHFIRKEYEKSEELAQKVLAAGRNDDPAVYLLKGRIARERQDERAMIESFTKVLQMSPGDLASRLEYVLALNAFEKQDLAMKEIEVILKQDPQNTYAQGLKALFSHQVRWMSKDEIEARRRAILEGPEDKKEEKEQTAEEKAADDAEFVDKVVSAMRAEAKRFDAKAIEADWLNYPGSWQFKNGQKQQGAIFLLLAVFGLAMIGWALYTGFDFRVPVNDFLIKFYSEEAMIEFIESQLEERVNDTVAANRIIIMTGFITLVGMVIYYIWSISLERAITYARKKALLCQIILIDGQTIQLDVGMDRGAEVGNTFQVMKISRRGKVPIGTAEIVKVEAQAAVASFTARVAEPPPPPNLDDLPEGEEPPPPPEPEEIPPPVVGDIVVPLNV